MEWNSFIYETKEHFKFTQLFHCTNPKYIVQQAWHFIISQYNLSQQNGLFDAKKTRITSDPEINDLNGQNCLHFYPKGMRKSLLNRVFRCLIFGYFIHALCSFRICKHNIQKFHLMRKKMKGKTSPIKLRLIVTILFTVHIVLFCIYKNKTV